VWPHSDAEPLTAKRTPAVSGITGAKTEYIRCPDALSLPTLFLEHLFDLSDLLLNFADVFFGVAFGL
jgi:hypothetical protein